MMLLCLCVLAGLALSYFQDVKCETPANSFSTEEFHSYSQGKAKSCCCGHMRHYFEGCLAKIFSAVLDPTNTVVETQMGGTVIFPAGGS